MAYRRNYNRRPTQSSGWRGPLALEVLNESITMSAAGTLTEIEVSLLEEVGKMRFGRVKAMMITDVVLEVHNETAGTGLDTDNATGDWLLFQCMSSEEGAEIEFSSKDCIFKFFTLSPGS